MPPWNARSIVRTLALTATLVASAAALDSSAGAVPLVPPDDGAPPSEYEPDIPALAGEPLSPERRATTALPELPESPPTDNAFPISGASRSSCTDSFGDPRGGGRIHLGVDCFAARGTPLVAVEAGAIRYATEGGPFSCTTGGDISGNRVSVRGRSGYVYYYGHLDTIGVVTDQIVEKGQFIGTVGATGNASCSRAHLHFEVKCGEHADPFDPYPVIASWGPAGPPPSGLPTTEVLGAGVVFSGSGRQDLFTLECGQALLQRAWTSGDGLSPAWYRVDGLATSDPDAASPGAGSLPQVFVRGSDHAAYQLYWNGSSWSVMSLGGMCTSGPAAAYANPAHLDVFCRGADRALYQRAWDAATGWSHWYRVGGLATSDPDAASPGPEYTADIFVRGVDNAVYQMYWSGVGWVTVNLGGVCSSGPSAAYSGPHRLDVFCRGSDMAIYHKHWLRGSGWSPLWTRIDGAILSDPEATSIGAGGVPQVFARGLDRRLYQYYWNGSTWARSVWGVT